jgi:hypothetical protein
MPPPTSFSDLPTLASHLRAELVIKKFLLLYAFNSTGKTRLSVAFKDLGKRGDERDTLYFNAFTEDLFQWDNDLENDRERVLKINQDSRFFAGLGELEMDNRIRPLLDRYADFEFHIDPTNWKISFARESRRKIEDGRYETVREEDIKISRGEENIFIWCFFLAIVQLTLDGAEAYKWVKYIYIDDPISSLDENNAIAVANHLAQMLTKLDGGPRVVVSTHHVLFFNVLCNELKNKAHRYFLKKDGTAGCFSLVDTSAQPFLQHLSNLVELDEAQRSGALSTYHFNMMRRVMEQTANFFGLEKWEACIAVADDDPDKTLYKRMIDLLSHGDYSIYEPREMMEENKEYFRTIFSNFIAGYPFNPALFQSEAPTP